MSDGISRVPGALLYPLLTIAGAVAGRFVGAVTQGFFPEVPATRHLALTTILGFAAGVALSAAVAAFSTVYTTRETYMKVLHSVLLFAAVFVATLLVGFVTRPRLLGIPIPPDLWVQTELGTYVALGIVLGLIAAAALFILPKFFAKNPTGQ